MTLTRGRVAVLAGAFGTALLAGLVALASGVDAAELRSCEVRAANLEREIDERAAIVCTCENGQPVPRYLQPER